MGKLGLILGIVNTLAIAAVLGLFVYTKVLYKHPPITETQERAKLAATSKVDYSHEKKVIINLDPITSNLDPFKDTDGKQKTHYLSMTIAVELRSQKDASKFEAARPVIMDKILQDLSKKKFEDLNQVQGRYVFRSQIIDSANEYLKEPVVTEIYFNDFLLQ